MCIVALHEIQQWLKNWRMKVNETKSIHVTVTLKMSVCPSVQLNSKHLAQPDDVKYLGIHLDRKPTWRKHITTKRKQLDLKLRKLYCIIGRQSQLSLENKLLVYKAMLKPVWTFGVQLWGSASNSNIGIPERFQSKVLRIITDAPWYVPNTVIRHDLRVFSVRQEVLNYSVTYSHRLDDHPKRLAKSLFQVPAPNRRLKRCYPADLATTRVGTLIVASIYLQLIQNRYMFRSFTVLQCSHQHCVQPVASDVEVVGYL